MTERPHGHESFHQCWECSGIWVARMLMHGLCHRRDESLAGSLQQLPPPTHRSSPIHCPGCNYLMAQRIQQQVQVDICPECRALWLDGGEILHIASRLRARQPSPQQSRSQRIRTALMRPPGTEHLAAGNDRIWSQSNGILEAASALLRGVLD